MEAELFHVLVKVGTVGDCIDPRAEIQSGYTIVDRVAPEL